MIATISTPSNQNTALQAALNNNSAFISGLLNAAIQQGTQAATLQASNQKAFLQEQQDNIAGERAEKFDAIDRIEKEREFRRKLIRDGIEDEFTDRTISVNEGRLEETIDQNDVVNARQDRILTNNEKQDSITNKLNAEKFELTSKQAEANIENLVRDDERAESNDEFEKQQRIEEIKRDEALRTTSEEKQNRIAQAVLNGEDVGALVESGELTAAEAITAQGLSEKRRLAKKEEEVFDEDRELSLEDRERKEAADKARIITGYRKQLDDEGKSTEQIDEAVKQLEVKLGITDAETASSPLPPTSGAAQENNSPFVAGKTFGEIDNSSAQVIKPDKLEEIRNLDLSNMLVNQKLTPREVAAGLFRIVDSEGNIDASLENRALELVGDGKSTPKKDKEIAETLVSEFGEKGDKNQIRQMLKKILTLRGRVFADSATNKTQSVSRDKITQLLNN